METIKWSRRLCDGLGGCATTSCIKSSSISLFLLYLLYCFLWCICIFFWLVTYPLFYLSLFVFDALVYVVLSFSLLICGIHVCLYSFLVFCCIIRRYYKIVSASGVGYCCGIFFDFRWRALSMYFCKAY